MLSVIQSAQRENIRDITIITDRTVSLTGSFHRFLSQIHRQTKEQLKKWLLFVFLIEFAEQSL